jgi:fatty-acyl-CoA synthase
MTASSIWRTLRAMVASGFKATNGKKAIPELAASLERLVTRVRNPEWHEILRTGLHVAPLAARSTLPWLIRARAGRDESLLKIALEHAESNPFGLAFEMDDVRLSWRELDELTSKLAHVLTELGVRKGDVVGLLGANSPLYLAIVLGVSRVGATAALINNHLKGHPLSHAVRVSTARIVLVQKRFEAVLAERSDLREQLEHVVSFDGGELEKRLDAAPNVVFSRVRVEASSDFVYIYTSGTTGLPKPCRVTHARSILAGAAFGPMMFEFKPGDKLYCALPLYHSNALLIGAGACIMTQTPMALRESFSASAFWRDVQRYRATAMIYIGELCRYLVNSAPSPEEKDNPLQVAVGNGLRADVWEAFQKRFDVPRIREFYSATEAPGIIFNFTGKVGSIGRVPFRRFSAMKLIRYDVETDTVVRDARGLCIECGPNEVGELVIRLPEKPRSGLSDFKGYTDPTATEKKILRDVLGKGDKYFRSGDLLRFDELDNFFFVDRIGDTYRWRGENVSTAEVAEVLGAVPGVREVTVSGVPVPGSEGQAGLAAVVCDGQFDAGAFWRVAQELPGYAQPRFVRILEQLQKTGTMKIQKTNLRSEGVDPTQVADPMYLRQESGYVPLTPELWRKVAEGNVRL